MRALRRESRRGAKKYCRDCWDKKIAVETVARDFALKRYIRAHSAEKYLIYHLTLKRPCGQLIVVDDGNLFLTLMLCPNFAWDEPAYHLGDRGSSVLGKSGRRGGG